MSGIHRCWFRRSAIVTAMVLTLVCCATSLAGLQPADELVVDRVDVELVLVDLVATDKRGNVVTDLRPEEIVLRDDGNRVEDFTLSLPKGAEAPTPAQAGALGPSDSAPVTRVQEAVSQPNTLVVFLDELHLHPPNRKRVLKQVRELVRRGMQPDDHVMVVTFDGELHVRQKATNDFSAVLDIIEDEMKSTRMPMLARLAQPEEALRIIEEQFSNQSVLGGFDSQLAGNISDDPCVQMGALARTHAQQAYSVVMRSIFGLRLLVDALAPIPGRKSLLHVSDGIPTTPGSEAYSLAIELCTDTGDYTTSSVLPAQSGWDAEAAWAELNEFQTTDEWRQLSAFANASQVSFFVLQASGLTAARNSGINNVRVTQNTEALQVMNARGALHYMADETGGEATFNTNDFSDAMRRAVRDVDRAYQIAFAPPREADGREHSITVDVTRPGVTLRHRKSYFAKVAGQDLNDQVISSLVLDQLDNPLSATLDVAAVEQLGGVERKVKVQIRVPLSKLVLVPGEGGSGGAFTAAVGGRLSNGRFLPIGRKTLQVRASDVDASTQTFLYEVDVPVRGKAVTLSVAVRDDVGGEVAQLVKEVDLVEGLEESAAGS